jgi:F-type H+-transporting ATPase subunit delta
VSNAASRKYARAFFALSEKAGDAELNGNAESLNGLAEALGASPVLAGLLSSPVFLPEEKRHVLLKLLDRLSAGAILRNFCMLLADKNRLTLLKDIAAVYANMLDEKIGTLRGAMTTAVPLPAGKQDSIKTHLEKISGKRIVLDFNVDEEILGGLILRVEDRVLDGSLKAQINILKNQIKRGE